MLERLSPGIQGNVDNARLMFWNDCMVLPVLSGFESFIVTVTHSGAVAYTDSLNRSGMTVDLSNSLRTK